MVPEVQIYNQATKADKRQTSKKGRNNFVLRRKQCIYQFRKVPQIYNNKNLDLNTDFSKFARYKKNIKKSIISTYIRNELVNM